jgi:hypothetical protein
LNASAAMQAPWSLNGTSTPKFGPLGATGAVGGRTVDSVHAATINASAASDKMGFRFSIESTLIPGPARFRDGMALSPLK